jgi:hypothetical protein
MASKPERGIDDFLAAHADANQTQQEAQQAAQQEVQAIL